jgi:hypothetical protein
MHFFRNHLLATALGAVSVGALGQNPTNFQNLFVTREVQAAYEKGTRSTDGKPGPNYWQNYSDYKIRVGLDPATRMISGTETVTYHNDSPNTVQNLVVRLYPEIFDKTNARDPRNVDPADLKDSAVVKLPVVKINGQDVKPNRQGTNAILRIPGGLPSKQTLTLDVTWSYPIPEKSHIREGTYFKTSFMVAYWYPQIAVYDDIHGWDVAQYTGKEEFYNDHSNFDVEVTVPASHLVWATGVWQNPDEILTAEYLDRYRGSRTSDQVVNVITAADREKGGIARATSGTHTFRYKAERVPDFVFAASDTYLWDASSVEVEPGRRVGVAAVYHPKSKGFPDVCRYARQSLEYFSKTLPAVPFPFPNETVFNGSGGMEFPMFVNDGDFGGSAFDAEVTAHEIAHSYFPFYMGINERRYAWMEEGMAQFLPNWLEFDVRNMGKKYRPQQTNAAQFSQAAGGEDDIPLMVPTNQIKGAGAHGMACYIRPAQAYTFLKDMLGDQKFLAALHEYMNRWHGKHPVPYDFFYSFNDFLKEDLSWYWKPWFFEKSYPDLALSEVTKGKKNKTKITVSKLGTLPTAVAIKITYDDGTTEEIRETARVWQNSNTYTVEREFPKKITKVSLTDNLIPDVNPKNNTLEVTQ